MTIRVFVAFDMEHDHDLYDKMTKSAGRRASFEISGSSERRLDPDTWTQTTKAQIAASEQVVVVCGAHTESSVSVAAELGMARSENKPFTLLWSRREIMCQKPVGALAADSMYSWTPEILERQLAANRRNASKAPEPARPSRQAVRVPDERSPLPPVAPASLAQGELLPPRLG